MADVKTGPKDVFLHLLSIITLYFSAVSLGILLYQLINIYFPDPLTDTRYFSPEMYYGPLRWAVASLLIVFPVYGWSIWYLQRDYRQAPKKLELKTRKWLLNFTLFAAALVIIGDLVALVYRYMEGDLTVRFGLKVMTILFIASAIFIYYRWQLRVAWEQRNIYIALLVDGVIGMVILAIISGFWIAGSPQNQRLRKFDQRRVTDLQDIQWQIINYWQRKDHLPGQLSDLIDDISGYRPPQEPQTQQPYEYRAVGDLQFELCANFNSEDQGLTGEYQPRAVPAKIDQAPESWAHTVGRACFSRTIDPELYKREPGQ